MRRHTAERQRRVGLNPTLARNRTPGQSAVRAPGPGPRPNPTPGAYTYQDDFLKEADEDVGKMAAVLEAAPANLHMSLQQARPATDTRRARRHTPRKMREPHPASRPPHPSPA
jgi:hypothetical protein